MNKLKKTEINQKNIAKLEARMIDSVSKKSNLAWYVNRVILLCIVGAFLLLAYSNMNRSEGSKLSTFTFEEAQERCKERGRVLPITDEDFNTMLFHPTAENKIGYWTNERKVAKLNIVFVKDDGIEHYLYCVKKNGLLSRSMRR